MNIIPYASFLSTGQEICRKEIIYFCGIVPSGGIPYFQKGGVLG
jgi:hypothetical protein